MSIASKHFLNCKSLYMGTDDSMSDSPSDDERIFPSISANTEATLSTALKAFIQECVTEGSEMGAAYKFLHKHVLIETLKGFTAQVYIFDLNATVGTPGSKEPLARVDLEESPELIVGFHGTHTNPHTHHTTHTHTHTHTHIYLHTHSLTHCTHHTQIHRSADERSLLHPRNDQHG
jgi:hypothetical protein